MKNTYYWMLVWYVLVTALAIYANDITGWVIFSFYTVLLGIIVISEYLNNK